MRINRARGDSSAGVCRPFPCDEALRWPNLPFRFLADPSQADEPARFRRAGIAGPGGGRGPLVLLQPDDSRDSETRGRHGTEVSRGLDRHPLRRGPIPRPEDRDSMESPGRWTPFEQVSKHELDAAIIPAGLSIPAEESPAGDHAGLRDPAPFRQAGDLRAGTCGTSRPLDLHGPAGHGGAVRGRGDPQVHRPDRREGFRRRFTRPTRR